MDDQTALSREVRALYRITEAINGSLCLADVLTAMLEGACRELGYKAATLRLLDEEQATLELAAAYGLSDSYLAKGEVAVAQSEIDQVVLRGQRATIHDVRQSPSFQYTTAAAREGLASVLAAPLIVHWRAIGVLRVYTAEPHRFTPEEQGFLAAVANLGAQAIQRTRLAAAFQTIARQVTSSLNLKEVLTTLLLQSVRELNVKAGSLRLLGARQQTLHLAAAYGLSDTYLQKGVVSVASSPIDQRVIESGELVAVTEVTRQAGLQYPKEAQREGIRSVLVAPLRVHDRVIGVLRLYSAQVRRFDAEELAFVATTADMGAIAIENARLHAALQARFADLQADANGWQRFLAFS